MGGPGVSASFPSRLQRPCFRPKAHSLEVHFSPAIGMDGSVVCVIPKCTPGLTGSEKVPVPRNTSESKRCASLMVWGGPQKL